MDSNEGSDSGGTAETVDQGDTGMRATEKRLKDEVSRKIESREWEVVRKEGRGVSSPAWLKFRLVRCATTKKFQNAVQCADCKLIKIYHQGSSTSPLKKHVCSMPDSGNISSSSGSDLGTGRPTVTTEMKNKMRDACVQWCAGDIRPFNVVEGNNFQNVIQTAIDLGAEHGKIDANKLVCDPNTISRAVDSTASQIKTELMQKLHDEIKKGLFAMTTDLWKEDFNKINYLTVTSHYIDPEWNLNSQVLFTSKFPEESETAENITNHLLTEFAKIDLSQEDIKEVKFVSDGGANIVKALNLLGVQRIYCADHCLNVVLKRTFTLPLVDLDLLGESANIKVDAAALAISLIKANKLDKHLCRLLKDIPPRTNEQGSSSHARYKQLHQALRTFVDNFDQICKVLEDAGHTSISSELNKNDLEEVFLFIKPIEDAAKNHGNSLENIDLAWLLKYIQSNEEDSGNLRLIKENARAALASLEALLVIKKCKTVVTLIKKWGLMSALEISLKQEVETRWNSVLLMLQSFPRNFDKGRVLVNEMLTARNRLELVTSEKKQGDIQELMLFLQEFKKESKKLEAERSPTLQYALLSYYELLKHCRPKLGDSSGVSNLRARAKVLLEEKFVLGHLHKMGTFFWPRFRRLRMLPTEAHEQVCQQVRLMMEMVKAAEHRDRADEPSPPKRRKTDEEYGDWCEEEEEQDEVAKYIADNLGDDSDIVKWWREKGTIQYPNLSKIARAILCIPGTSAASERVFSRAGCTITQRRTSLDPETVDNLLFLNSFYKK